MSKRILFLSNGTGEDRIALELARNYTILRPEDTLLALPVVGNGHFYTAQDIPLVAQTFEPPSAGFAYLNPRLLLGDFRAGLGSHLKQVLASLRSHNYDEIIAVGDIVVVLLATLSRKPFAFVACALSDHYLPEMHKSTFDPLQILLLRQQRVKVFPRDAKTHANLLRKGLDSYHLGNPMLDCLDIQPLELPWTEKRPRIGLFPGSRDDALANLRLILSLLPDAPYQYVLFVAPQLNKAELIHTLHSASWEKSGQVWQLGDADLYISETFSRDISSLDTVIGLAGTANEQAVALGVPVISFPGFGKQYAYAFGDAQQRLLGQGLHFLPDVTSELLAQYIDLILKKPAFKRACERVAFERFGRPGASQRIIQALLNVGIQGSKQG